MRSEANDEDRIESLLAQYLGQLEDAGTTAAEAVLRGHDEVADLVRARASSLSTLGLLPPTKPERLGRYRIGEVLGQGTMGVVFRAYDEHLGRDVAVKAIRPEHLFFPEPRMRFRREVEILTRLRHPHLVSVLDAGEEQGLPFYAMELIEGASLAQAMTVGGRDLDAGVGSVDKFVGPWAQVCVRIVAQVADALGHAHAHGVAHRDVKPANILLGRDGRALLVDFGLGRVDDSHTSGLTRGAVGSLDYLAPELLRPDPPEQGPRQDVFALGKTLYFLLHAAGSARLARDIETVCQVALDEDPLRRYADGAAMASDLRAVLDLRPLRARRPGGALRARRWVTRHPARAIGLGSGAIVTLLGCLWIASRVETRRVQSRYSALIEFQEALFSESELLRQGPILNMAAALQAILPRFLPRLQDDPVSLAKAYVWAGRCLMSQGQPGAAEAYFARATSIADIDAHTEVDALCALAQSLCMAHRHADAAATIGRAEERARRDLGPRSPTLAALLVTKGQVCAQDYRWGSAIPCFEAALTIVEDMPAMLDMRLQIQIGLASAWRWSHCRCREADALLQTVVDLATATRGPDSVWVQQALREQASVRLLRGEWNQAVSLARRSLELARRIYGPEDHPQIALAQNDLGLILRDSNHAAEAEAHLRACFATHRKFATAESHVLIDKRINLATVLRETRRFAEAEDLLRDALEIARAELPAAAGNPNSLEYECENQLARLFLASGQGSRAEPLLQQSISRLRKSPGTRWTLAWHQGLLADALRARGELARAEEFYRESVTNNLETIYADVSYRRLNHGESIFEQNLHSLCALLTARADLAGVVATERDVAQRLRDHLTQRAQIPSAEPIATASIHRLLGTTLVRLEEFAAAREHLTRALEILEYEASPNHAEAVAARHWLARCPGPPR